MRIRNINTRSFSGTFEYENNKRKEKIINSMGFVQKYCIKGCMDELEKSIINDTPDKKHYRISLDTDYETRYLYSDEISDNFLSDKYLKVRVEDIADENQKDAFESRISIEKCEECFILNKSTNVWRYLIDTIEYTSGYAIIKDAFDSIIERITKKAE